MSKLVRTALSCALAATLLLISISFSANAQAATNQYTPTEVCGSGYYVLPNGTLPLTNNGSVWGYSYLLYNSSTQNNCVATIKRVEVGVSTYTVAAIQVQGHNETADAGYFEYYAGPKYVHAPGQCVRFRGVIWEDDMVRYAQAQSSYGWCS